MNAGEIENIFEQTVSLQNPKGFGALPLLGKPSPTDRNLPRVLVVDDDPVFCKIMKGVGKKHHLSVTTCRTLSEVLSLPEKAEFDVAILDYFFGELTGVQIAYLLKNEPPIFYVSGQEISDDALVTRKTVRGFANKSKGAEKILDLAMHLSSVHYDAEELEVGLFPEYEIWNEIAEKAVKKFRESRLSKWLGLMGVAFALSFLFTSGSPITPSRALHLEQPELQKIFFDHPAPIKWDQAPKDIRRGTS